MSAHGAAHLLPVIDGEKSSRTSVRPDEGRWTHQAAREPMPLTWAALPRLLNLFPLYGEKRPPS